MLILLYIDAVLLCIPICCPHKNAVRVQYFKFGGPLLACLRNDFTFCVNSLVQGNKTPFLYFYYTFYLFLFSQNMFVLALVEDEVKIQPNDFRNEIKTIEESIERKYCGKVSFPFPQFSSYISILFYLIISFRFFPPFFLGSFKCGLMYRPS